MNGRGRILGTTKSHRAAVARGLAAGLLAVAFAGSLTALPPSRSRKPRKSPHFEIVVLARVEAAPKKTVHSNRREFEEFDVVIVSSRPAADQPRDADTGITVLRDRAVHVVHDLSCGGTWLDLEPGDEVELQGEYVQPPNGKDLIHFTHPSGGECGSGESHPGGYLRKKARAA